MHPVSRARRSTANYTSVIDAEALAHDEEVEAQRAAIEEEDQELERNQAMMDEEDEDYYNLSSEAYSSSQATAATNDEEDDDAEDSEDSEDEGSDAVTEYEAPSSSPRTRSALVIEPDEADENDEHGSDSVWPSGW